MNIIILIKYVFIEYDTKADRYKAEMAVQITLSAKVASSKMQF